jgi:hypothetical protein
MRDVRRHRGPDLLPALGFLLVSVKTFRTGAASRPISLVLLLAAIVWTAYWGYEMQLNAWMVTVKAPIRSEILVTGPLLYYVSVVGFALTDRTREAGGDDRSP